VVVAVGVLGFGLLYLFTMSVVFSAPVWKHLRLQVLLSSSVTAARVQTVAPKTTDASGLLLAPSIRQMSRFRGRCHYRAQPCQCSAVLWTWRTPDVVLPPLKRSKKETSIINLALETQKQCMDLTKTRYI